MSLVSLLDVEKKYSVGTTEVTALAGVNLDVRAGAMLVVLGASGSGKSTLLNVLGGMDVPTSGTIRALGQTVSELDDEGLSTYRRDHVGFVFQHYNLIPNLTAAENVGIGSQFAHDPIDPADALARVGLDGRGDSFPSELSGGQMQRVAIARAIAKRPQLLLCDEPTGALDSETGRAVVGLLRTIADESETAVVIVTHNASIAAVADSAITLHDGRVLTRVEHPTPASVWEMEW